MSALNHQLLKRTEVMKITRLGSLEPLKKSLRTSLLVMEMMEILKCHMLSFYTHLPHSTTDLQKSTKITLPNINQLLKAFCKLLMLIRMVKFHLQNSSSSFWWWTPPISQSSSNSRRQVVKWLQNNFQHI